MSMIFTPAQTFGPHRASAWTMAFEIFLLHYTAYVEAEQELEYIDHNTDPSLSLWQRDKDVAQLQLKNTIEKLQNLPVRLLEDRPLRLFVELVGKMVDNDGPKTARQLHREMCGRFTRQYQIAGIGPVARRRNEMLLHARSVANAMVALSFYDYVPADDGCFEGASEADELLPCEI